MDGVELGGKLRCFPGDRDPFLKKVIPAAAPDGYNAHAAVIELSVPVSPRDECDVMPCSGKLHEALEPAVQGMMGVIGPMVAQVQQFHFFCFHFTSAKFLTIAAIRQRAMSEPV